MLSVILAGILLFMVNNRVPTKKTNPLRRTVITATQTIQYVSADGQIFVYEGDLPTGDGKLLYSPDGVTFHAVGNVTQRGGDETNHGLRFDTNDVLRYCSLDKFGDRLRYHNTEFIAMGAIQVDPDSIVPLPKERMLQWVGFDEFGWCYLLTNLRYHASDAAARLYIGKGVENLEYCRIEAIAEGAYYTEFITNRGTMVVGPPYGWLAPEGARRDVFEDEAAADFTIEEFNVNGKNPAVVVIER
jgi:hypothetical protein